MKIKVLPKENFTCIIIYLNIDNHLENYCAPGYIFGFCMFINIFGPFFANINDF